MRMRRIGEGVMKVGDVAQQHNVVPESESSEKQKQLGFFYSHKVYLYLINMGGHFVGYAKQEGSKRLKLCLFRLYLKQLDVRKCRGFWCQWVLELMGLTCCEEVNSSEPMYVSHLCFTDRTSGPH